jgi:hypothetical protein
MSSVCRTPSKSHKGTWLPAAIAACIIERSGVTPVPVATKRDGCSSVGLRVKNPCGPIARSRAPGPRPQRYPEPGPPVTSVTASSKRGVPFGADAIEYARRMSPPSSGRTRFNHCPGSNASGRPSTRSNTNDLTLGASTSAETIAISNVSGVI